MIKAISISCMTIVFYLLLTVFDHMCGLQRMPGIDAHLNPEDLPTKAPAHVRFSRGYYYENSPMGPLRDQHDEYNRPRRLWNYSDAKDMKTQWTTTPIRPRVPRPNAVTHQLASQDFKVGIVDDVYEESSAGPVRRL